MTPAELEALRARVADTAPISTAAHDVRALLVYCDQLREVVAAAQKYTDNMGEHHYWRCCCSDSGPDCTCGGAELWAALAKLGEP